MITLKEYYAERERHLQLLNEAKQYRLINAFKYNHERRTKNSSQV